MIELGGNSIIVLQQKPHLLNNGIQNSRFKIEAFPNFES